MDTKSLNPRQRDIDRRLRDSVGAGLADWLTDQRAEPKTSFGAIALELHRLTGDTVSDETLRAWVKALVSTADGGRDGAAA